MHLTSTQSAEGAYLSVSKAPERERDYHSVALILLAHANSSPSQSPAELSTPQASHLDSLVKDFRAMVGWRSQQKSGLVMGLVKWKATQLPFWTSLQRDHTRLVRTGRETLK